MSAIPVDPAAILDDALIGQIRTVYGQDWVNYEKAQQQWAPLSPDLHPHETTNPPLIDHKRAVRPKTDPSRLVTGAYLSGIERIEGTVVDVADTAIGSHGTILVRDPMSRFIDAMLTIGSDGKMLSFRYARVIHRARSGGQWTDTPETLDQLKSNFATFTGIFRAMPGLLSRHGLRPQYQDVQDAMAVGFSPQADIDPSAEAGFSAPSEFESQITLLRANMPPELAETVRNLYRADFELYERLVTETS